MYLTYFHQEVKWEPREQDITEKLNNTESSKYHPVHQPFSVIILIW